MQKVQQVVGILPRGIEADEESDMGMSLSDLFETLAELGVALGRLGELKVRRGRLQVVAQEGRIVSVP